MKVNIKKTLWILGVALVIVTLLLHPSSWSPISKEHVIADGEETIFVSVASYRDDDCSQTLKSMYANAKYPQRIFAGVCQQNKAGEAKEECVDPNLPWRQNVRVISMPYTEAKGPTYARYKCASLYKGETYFCQIDSHTTFAKDWDEAVIRDLKSCPSPKPIITFYPHDRATKNPGGVPVLCKSKFTPEKLVTFEAVTLAAAESGDDPKPVPFVAGGFFFGRGSIPVEVPFDESLDYLFNGEEIAYSARLWTSGYDFFAPRQNYVFHFYTRSGKPKFWEDIKEYGERQKHSQQKVVRLLGLDGQPPLKNYRWGMGTQRSVEDYLQFAGLDAKAQQSSSEKKFCR